MIRGNRVNEKVEELTNKLIVAIEEQNKIKSTGITVIVRAKEEGGRPPMWMVMSDYGDTEITEGDIEDMHAALDVSMGVNEEDK